MQPEKILTKNIQAICGENGIICFDVNVGRVELLKGGWFDSGLPQGFSDLLLFYGKGKVAFLEAKIKPNKPSKAQVDFINLMKSRGYLAGVVYSVEQFREEYLPKLCK